MEKIRYVVADQPHYVVYMLSEADERNLSLPIAYFNDKGLAEAFVEDQYKKLHGNVSSSS